MKTFLRRLRGIGGIALTWSLIWAGLGAAIVIGRLVLYGSPFVVTRPAILTTALTVAAVYGIYGFEVGMLFGSVLALAERRRTIEQLNAWRIAGWGAVAGAAVPLATTALVLLSGGGRFADTVSTSIIAASLGAMCASGTLKIARAGSSERLRGPMGDQGRIPGGGELPVGEDRRQATPVPIGHHE